MESEQFTAEFYFDDRAEIRENGVSVEIEGGEEVVWLYDLAERAGISIGEAAEGILAELRYAHLPGLRGERYAGCRRGRVVRRAVEAYVEGSLEGENGRVVEALPDGVRVSKNGDVVGEVWPSGATVAHEIRLREVSVEEVEEVTYGYGAEAIDTEWYLGEEAATEEVLNWLWEDQYQAYLLRLGHPGVRLAVSEVEIESAWKDDEDTSVEIEEVV